MHSEGGRFCLMSSTVEVVETFERPSPEYPDGSYLRTVGGNVQMATGRYAKHFKDKPSLYLDGKPPFTVLWDVEARPLPAPEIPSPRDPAVPRRDEDYPF
jgi:hypothetical protein